MRNLIDVINEMLKVVPKKEKQIISYLKDIQDSQKYRAPEDMIGWHQVSEMLQEFEYNKKTPTKKDFDEPLVPERCKDCEHLCISHATGLTRKNGHPVATCKLNHARHGCDELWGTYEPCSNVIFLSPIYKCKYDDKERLA